MLFLFSSDWYGESFEVEKVSLPKGWKIFLELRLEQLDPVLYVPVPLRGYMVAKNGNRER